MVDFGACDGKTMSSFGQEMAAAVARYFFRYIFKTDVHYAAHSLVLCMKYFGFGVAIKHHIIAFHKKAQFV